MKDVVKNPASIMHVLTTSAQVSQPNVHQVIERGAVLRIIIISGLIINYDISRFFLYVSSKG